MFVCSRLYGVCVRSTVPAGVLLVFGWVEKLLINALSIAGWNHAGKMFTHPVLQHLLKVIFNTEANFTLTSHIL
jgi:hypothetical protein